MAMATGTSYFGNTSYAGAPTDSVYSAAAVAPAPPPPQTNVGLYVGVAVAVTILLFTAWWWTRASVAAPSTPERLELEDFRSRIAAIENPDHRADMEEWLRFCEGAERPNVHAILMEVLRSNLGPGAGGTLPPAGSAAPDPRRAAAPQPPQRFRMVAPADGDDELFTVLR